MENMAQRGSGTGWKRSLPIGVAAASLLWLALFIFFAGHDSIWYDELFSVAQSRMPLHELLRSAAGDIHPPGYPLALKAFLRLFGDSWFAARLFSVFTVFLSAALIAVGCRDRRVGAASAASFLLLPAVGFCALDIRMYALTMLFLALFFVCALRLISPDRRRWPYLCGLGFAAWGGALTLNYAVLYLAVPAAWLLVSLWRDGRRKKCGVAAAVLLAAAVAYLPWMPSAWGQLTRVRSEFWAPPLTVKACVLILDMPFMGYSLKFFYTLALAAAVLILLAAAICVSYRRDRARFVRLCWLVSSAVFPAACGIAWSLLRGRALIIDRAMLPACVPLGLALGEAFASASVRRRIKVLAAAVMALYFVFHVCCIAYRTRDGVLSEVRDCLRDRYAGAVLCYAEAHGAADAAGLVPERRHAVISDEADPMGMLILGNVDVVKSPPSGGNRIFILGEESPEEFRRRIPGVGKLTVEREFYSRYRFQHFKICREIAPPTP